MVLADLYLTAKTLLGLKEVPRSGWLRSGVLQPESVADHSWGTAILCLLFGDYYGIDASRALQIAVVHDAAEVITGDIAATPELLASAEKVAEKSAGEAEAISTMFPTEATAHLTALWEEYEQSHSREALVVRDLNLLDMALQALLYTSEARRTTQSLSQFLNSAGERLHLPESRAIFQLIEQDFAKFPSKVK